MNYTALLLAIATIETGNVDTSIGSRGERSRYQIKPRVWAHYTKSRAYTDPRLSTLVAELILHDNIAIVGFDPYLNAAAWNYGALRTKKRATNLPPSVRDYATRVLNLYKIYDKRHTTTILSTSVPKIRSCHQDGSGTSPIATPVRTPRNRGLTRDSNATSPRRDKISRRLPLANKR